MKSFAIVLVEVVCLCMAAPLAPAQFLLTEDFDYPAGDSLKLHDWVMTGSPSSYSYVNPLCVTMPGLEYPGYRGSRVGNAVTLASSGQDVCRYFAQPAKGGSVYVFLLVRVLTARSSGDYFLHLIGGTASSSAFAPKLSVKFGENRIAFGISKRANAGAAVYTPFEYDVDSTYLLVIKYTFRPDTTTDDAVSLFVFGPSGLSTSEPGTPTVGPVVEASAADVDSLCLCALRQGSSSSAPTVVVDGIRVTASWEGALPIQISSFQGAVEDSGIIRLTWITQSEIDVYGFEVERSDGADLHFVTVSGLIPGHNTTTEPQSYTFIDRALPVGRWFYRLRTISLDQSVAYSDVIEISNVADVGLQHGVPDRFELEQNYPNPFNPKTGIRFQVPGVSDVRITVYDMLGREVAVLVNERKAAGTYEVSFDGSGLASGLYIYRLTAGNFVQSRAMLLVR